MPWLSSWPYFWRWRIMPRIPWRNILFWEKKCLKCDKGFISKRASESGIPCEPGFYSNKNQTKCLQCEDGYISSEKSYLCSKCQNGYFSNNNHTICIKCPEDYYYDNISNSCIEKEEDNKFLVNRPNKSSNLIVSIIYILIYGLIY